MLTVAECTKAIMNVITYSAFPAKTSQNVCEKGLSDHRLYIKSLDFTVSSVDDLLAARFFCPVAVALLSIHFLI